MMWLRLSSRQRVDGVLLFKEESSRVIFQDRLETEEQLRKLYLCNGIDFEKISKIFECNLVYTCSM